MSPVSSQTQRDLERALLKEATAAIAPEYFLLRLPM